MSRRNLGVPGTASSSRHNRHNQQAQLSRSSSNIMRSGKFLAAAIQHNEDEVDGILNVNQLQRIKMHKYKSSGSSILDASFQPFWGFVVECVPLNIAPNLLTMVGLVCNLATSSLLFYFCPNATEEPPRFILFLSAIGLFLYQTLDAIDGKQARRTSSSSPLGELFDHGCDTLSCVLLIANGCICLRIGHWPWLMMTVFMVVLSAFYTAHWQAYVTGELKFGMIDVTEAQCTAMLFQLVCAVIGTEWLIATSEDQYKLVSFLTTNITNSPAIPLAIFVALAACYVLFSNLAKIPDGGVGINGSSVADSSIVFPGFQLIFVIVSCVIIARKSSNRIFESNAVLYLLTFGLVWCKYTNRLIIASMSRSNVRMYDTILTGPILLLLNQYFNFPVGERVLLLIAFVYSIFDLVRYNSRVCVEIAGFLEIHVFRIKQNPNMVTTTVETAPKNSK